MPPAVDLTKAQPLTNPLPPWQADALKELSVIDAEQRRLLKQRDEIAIQMGTLNFARAKLMPQVREFMQDHRERLFTLGGTVFRITLLDSLALPLEERRYQIVTRPCEQF